MIKHYEMSNPNSCINKAKEHEMVFVLLARDPAAPWAIRAWIRERLRMGKNEPNDSQIVEAEMAAEYMERQIIVRER